jgi:hypothetical protein
MTLLDVQSGSARRDLAVRSRGMVRWVCTSNPFYVLSALLVCLGLWVSFGAQTETYQTWALLLGMVGYTLLLAVTACLLVRFIGIWDDVRTVLLLVILMFLATSVTFDDVLARDSTRGINCYLGGLVFAIVVSEGMLRTIGLRLPPLFRVPYYLALALFFLYPVAIVPLLDRPFSEGLSWALLGFSPAAGLVFLTLIPAIRRGREYVCDNGSPWRWAWYPWMLFGVLGFAVVARSALLAWSMHHMPSAETEPYIFGPYFLVPFGFAVAILVLEIGMVERRQGVVWVALLLPLVLVILSAIGHRDETMYRWFLGQFIDRLGGTPLFLTLLASAGFYGYAALRRVPAALDAMTAALLMLAFVSPQSLDLRSLTGPGEWPIMSVAVVQAAVGLRRHSAWRCLIATSCAAFSVAISLRSVAAGIHQGPLVFHLALCAVLLVGAAFDDRLGRLLRTAGATLTLLGAFVAMTGQIRNSGGAPGWLIEAYPLIMASAIAAYGFVLRHRYSFLSAALIVACWLAIMGGRGYVSLRGAVVGLDYIAIGMVLLALAVLTSMAKGGALRWRPGSRAKVSDMPE